MLVPIIPKQLLYLRNQIKEKYNNCIQTINQLQENKVLIENIKKIARQKNYSLKEVHCREAYI